jgi:hypothetical protein
MNQVKVSAPDGGWLKVKVIANPNEASRTLVRRQKPSARTFFQEWFRRRCEVGKRESNDG